jgi:hypothetical protein
VPPTARCRLAVSSEEGVMKEESACSKTKHSIFKASMSCESALWICLTHGHTGGGYVYARIKLAIGTHIFDFVLGCSVCTYDFY